MNRVEAALKAATETKALQIGNGILDHLAPLFKEQFPGKKAIIVADTTTYEVAGKQTEEILRSAGVGLKPTFIFRDPDLYAEYGFVNQLVDNLQQHEAIPVAVGSGTINDICKRSSFVTGRRYMNVSTAASMDGYTSYGASITKDGAKQTFDCPAPQAVLADIDIIREAPAKMTASGYADLFAKVPAGADWILADALGVEAIDKTAWSIVQDGLHDALQDPEGAAAGKDKAIHQLIEGLMLGGFAMQWAHSSRPASGADHQFSHLWNMEHHLNHGEHVSHGFQVSIGMLASTAMYELAMETPFDQLNIDACVAAWPKQSEIDKRAEKMFAGTDFPTIGVTETRAKYVDKKELERELTILKENWSEIRNRLKKQIVPLQEAKRRLKLVGAPTEPEQIGISKQRLCESFVRAQYIRRRFTILDLAVRTQMMEPWLNQLFGKDGVFEL